VKIRDVLETLYFGFKEVFDEHTRRRETPRRYNRCIWENTEEGELQMLCSFPAPPWWGKTPEEQAELQAAFDEFYAKYPDWRKYAPTPPEAVTGE
jgi:hypothetical protein